MKRVHQIHSFSYSYTETEWEYLQTGFSQKPSNVSCGIFLSFRKLAGCTLFITGASRGIGKAIALKAARDGANVVIAAKTSEPHPKLPGTIYTAAQEGEELTG